MSAPKSAPAAAVAEKKKEHTAIDVKPGELLGGGVLKKTFSHITGFFDGFQADKISATSKSSHGENVKLELAGSRALASGKGPVVDNSATLRLARNKYGLALSAAASGKASAEVSLAEAVKGAGVKAGVSYDFGKSLTTTTSSIDFSNDRVTSNVSFNYPWGGRLSADVSAVAHQSGVSFGARALVSAAVGAADHKGKAKEGKGKDAFTLDAYEAALGYKRGRVQVALAYSDIRGEKPRKTLTGGLAVDVSDRAKAGAAASLQLGQKGFDPEFRVGGKVKVNDDHHIRATVTLPTAEVAFQLASQFGKDLKTTASVAASLSHRTPAIGFGIDLQH